MGMGSTTGESKTLGLKIQDSLVELNLNALMILEIIILKFTLLDYKVRKYRDCVYLVHLYILSF